MTSLWKLFLNFCSPKNFITHHNSKTVFSIVLKIFIGIALYSQTNYTKYCFNWLDGFFTIAFHGRLLTFWRLISHFLLGQLRRDWNHSVRHPDFYHVQFLHFQSDLTFWKLRAKNHFSWLLQIRKKLIDYFGRKKLCLYLLYVQNILAIFKNLA